jgi:inner membrane protein
MLTHSIIGLAGAKILRVRKAPVRFLVLSVICSAVPDVDNLLARVFSIPYGHFFGHRGFFHSPFFALLFSLFVVFVFFHKSKSFHHRRFNLVAFFFLLTVSHGLFDALTTGGKGVAFLSPFSNTRYLFPWTPIQASPFGVTAIFTPLGQQAFADEFAWLLFPMFLIWLVVWIARKIHMKEHFEHVVHDRTFW